MKIGKFYVILSAEIGGQYIVTDRGEAMRKRQVEFQGALKRVGQSCVVQWTEFGLT